MRAASNTVGSPTPQGGAARRAAPHGRRAGALRSPLAFARPSQSSRRSLRGRSPAGARAPPGGGLAAAAFAVLARSGRHRLGSDCPHRCQHRDRDEDQNLRRATPLPCARTGDLAVPPPAKVVPPGRSGSTVPRRVRGVQRSEHGVLVVSIDRLTPMLRMAAGTVPPVVQSSR
jgi:hypothetical protein